MLIMPSHSLMCDLGRKQLSLKIILYVMQTMFDYNPFLTSKNKYFKNKQYFIY